MKLLRTTLEIECSGIDIDAIDGILEFVEIRGPVLLGLPNTPEEKKYICEMIYLAKKYAKKIHDIQETTGCK